MGSQVGLHQCGQCLPCLGEVGSVQGREVNVFGGTRARHPGEHAHPALEQPLGLLARREDAAEETVPRPVDLGGVTAVTWSYRGEIPGPEIRVRQGDTVQVTLANRLPDPTTVHWHGIAIRDNMDGVPVITQAPVAAGRDFTYRFTAADPGTYWYHPHVGVQLDRGRYGPLIVEDPAEPGAYDHEWTVVLDDWIDGTGYTPDQVLAALRNGMGGMGPAPASPSPSASATGGMSGMSMTSDSPSPSMSGMSSTGSSPVAGMSPTAGRAGGGMSGPMLSGASSRLLGGDAGDVRYPYYLINGHIRTAPRTFTARPGQRVRIRFINAGADTAFRVALGDGVFPLVALAEGKDSTALALVRTGAGTAPSADVRPAELGKVLNGYAALRPAASTVLPSRAPDVTHRLELTGGMDRYNWGINGMSLDSTDPGALRFGMRQGQRVRVVFANTTAMYHPMHIHGHTFALSGTGTRKDTVIVLPNQPDRRGGHAALRIWRGAAACCLVRVAAAPWRGFRAGAGPGLRLVLRTGARRAGGAARIGAGCP